MNREYIEKERALQLLEENASDDEVFFAARAIEAEPSADVKPVVRGEWVKVDADLYWCSHCHSEIEMRDIYIAECRYCPICGAYMRREKDDERRVD